MLALIPLGDGQTLHRDVYAWLAMQSVQVDIVPYTRPMVRHEGRRARQAANLNSLREYATGPYTVVMDSDVVCTSPTDVADCVAYLEAHTGEALVCLNTKPNIIEDVRKAERAGHVCIAFSVWRTSALVGYTFVGTDEECCCMDVNRRLRPVYLDGRGLREVKR